MQPNKVVFSDDICRCAVEFCCGSKCSETALPLRCLGAAEVRGGRCRVTAEVCKGGPRVPALLLPSPPAPYCSSSPKSKKEKKKRKKDLLCALLHRHKRTVMSRNNNKNKQPISKNHLTRLFGQAKRSQEKKGK